MSELSIQWGVSDAGLCHIDGRSPDQLKPLRSCVAMDRGIAW
jgi:hypothetical protein